MKFYAFLESRFWTSCQFLLAFPLCSDRFCVWMQFLCTIICEKVTQLPMWYLCGINSLGDKGCENIGICRLRCPGFKSWSDLLLMWYRGGNSLWQCRFSLEMPGFRFLLHYITNRPVLLVYGASNIRNLRSAQYFRYKGLGLIQVSFCRLGNRSKVSCVRFQVRRYVLSVNECSETQGFVFNSQFTFNFIIYQSRAEKTLDVLIQKLKFVKQVDCES
jgi:hypothetical protein